MSDIDKTIERVEVVKRRLDEATAGLPKIQAGHLFQDTAARSIMPIIAELKETERISEIRVQTMYEYNAEIGKLGAELETAQKLLSRAYFAMSGDKDPSVTHKQLRTEYCNVHQEIGEFTGRIGKAKQEQTDERK